MLLYLLRSMVMCSGEKKTFAFLLILFLSLSICFSLGPNSENEICSDSNDSSNLSISTSDYGYFQGPIPSGSSLEYGVFRWSTGEIYSGYWSNGTLNGEGTLIYPSLGTYVRSFRNGLRHGQGTFSTIDGKILSGQWDEDVFVSGTLTDNRNKINLQFSGDCYLANGCRGNMSGSSSKDAMSISIDSNGVYCVQFENGDKYSGMIENGMRNGIGTYTWKDGTKYEGSWVNDKMSGSGKYCFAGTKGYLKGGFKDNVPSGEVSYFYMNTEYITSWSNGICKSIRRK